LPWRKNISPIETYRDNKFDDKCHPGRECRDPGFRDEKLRFIAIAPDNRPKETSKNEE